MRYVLAVLTFVLPLDARAEGQKAAIQRHFGPHAVTYYDDVPRLVLVPDGNAKVCGPAADTTGGIANDVDFTCFFLVGCVTAPVCKPKTKQVARRVTGFEVSRRDGQNVGINDKKARRVLARFCRAEGRTLTPVADPESYRQIDGNIRWYHARCQ